MDLAKADRTVRALKAADRPVEKPLVAGISVRVTSGGQKTLYLRVKVNGKPQRLRLGVYPACTVKDAFDRSLALRAEIKEGRDPRIDDRRLKAGSNTPLTVADAVSRYVAEHCKVKQRKEWAAETERLLTIDVVPKIGSYPLKQLTRADLSNLIAKKAEAIRAKGRIGIAANRLSAVLSRFIRFSGDYGWLDPAIGLRLPKPASERARERNLTPLELGTLWTYLQAVRGSQGPCPAVYGDILSLLLLTGWRTTEITRMTVSRVDPTDRSIAIEIGKTDASRRKVLLPPFAWSIVQTSLDRLGGALTDGLLFPAPQGGELPENEVSRAARRIVKALDMAPWTPRDLRRTATSRLADLGVDGDVRRRITGHVAPDVHGRVYDKSQRLQDGLAALRLLEDWVLARAATTSNHADNVININELRVTPRK